MVLRSRPEMMISRKYEIFTRGNFVHKYRPNNSVNKCSIIVVEQV